MKYLIAGLGNPGAEYADTRHNIGFMVVNRLLQTAGIMPQPARYAQVAEMRHKGRILYLIQPSTYMNLSGNALRYYLQQHQVGLENTLVITDDISLPLGTCRLRPSGSDGGHNGLKHIQEILGSQNYARMRIGVGANFPKGRQADYVLSPFSPEEQQLLPLVLEHCAQGVLSFVTQGLQRTMNTFNNKKIELPPPPKTEPETEKS